MAIAEQVPTSCKTAERGAISKRMRQEHTAPEAYGCSSAFASDRIVVTSIDIVGKAIRVPLAERMRRCSGDKQRRQGRSQDSRGPQHGKGMVKVTGTAQKHLL